MKKIFILLFIIVIASTETFSQVQKDSTREYIVLWVNYSVVKEGVIPKLYIETGTSKNHSLYGVVKNGDADNIIFTDENSTKVFSSETDILNYLSVIGWKIYDIKVVNLLSKDYIKYLLYRMK
jgi:hypothetical protein